MALTIAAAQGSMPATVVFTHKGAFDRDVERVGDQCWIPLPLFRDFGWSASIRAEKASVSAAGFTAEARVRGTGREARVNLNDCLEQIGVGWRWDGDRLVVTSPIKKLEIRDDRLLVESLLPVRLRTFRLPDPARYVVDLEGATPHTSLRAELPPGARLGQYDGTTLRIVFPTPDAEKFPLTPNTVSHSFSVRVPKPVPVADSGPLVVDPASEAPMEAPTEIANDPEEVRGPSDPSEQAAPTVPETSPGLLIAGPPVQSGLTLRIPVVGGAFAPSVGYADPTIIEVRIPRASPHPALWPAEWQPPLRMVEAVQDPNGTLRIRIHLSQACGFRFTTANNAVSIVLSKPSKADGKLAGKTIVIDAGHGGSDGGARAPDGSALEKNLALGVARTLAERLSAEGAAVLMTRDTDVRIGLTDRPAIANRSRADAFVSVHFNSNRVANSRSGIMVFHHKQEPLSRLLADCLQRRLAVKGGMPSLGIRSDTTIYKSGFAVLRNSTVPSVLMELGFINHRADRKRMTQPSFRTDVAEAVVQGLKVFFGDASEKEEE